MFPRQTQIPLSLKARLTVPQILQSKQQGLTHPFRQSQGHLGWEMGLGLLALALEVKLNSKQRLGISTFSPPDWLSSPRHNFSSWQGSKEGPERESKIILGNNLDTLWEHFWRTTGSFSPSFLPSFSPSSPPSLLPSIANTMAGARCCSVHGPNKPDLAGFHSLSSRVKMIK